MKLKDIFDQLSAGEFRQLSLGGAEAGVIDESNYAAVVSHINLGLMALFRRFTLRKGKLRLQLLDGVDLYRLAPAYAVATKRSQAAQRYILDSAENPFPDDLAKVERVVDERHRPLGLNDAHDPCSLHTPSDSRLEVPAQIPRQVLTVEYRATHPAIVVGNGYFDPSRVEVELPVSYLDALLYYVASRVQAPMGIGGTEGSTSIAYFQRYEAACVELENKGLQVDQGASNHRLERNGWV